MHTNVVHSWRSRGLLLQRQGWHCTKCDKLALVRRRCCSLCQSTALERIPLPRKGILTALCLSGEVIETLDQLSQLLLVGLVKINDNSTIACQIGYSRPVKKQLASLHNKPCRLAVRKLHTQIAATAPLSYGLKAVFDLAVLKQLHDPNSKRTP